MTVVEIEPGLRGKGRDARRATDDEGKRVIDLTPAAIGPFMVPPVNFDTLADVPNVNMVTCGGQATIPMVAAVNRVAKVHYGEIVASIASKSAGPGTRANIDEFTETTAHAIEQVGGATKGKAIIILNPAEPPLVMRDTVFTLSDLADTEAIKESIHQMVAEVQQYVPGYQLHQDVQFEVIPPESAVFIEGLGKVSGLKTTVMLQVRGAAHYLPEYAGNLDIMTSAALATAERMVANGRFGRVPSYTTFAAMASYEVNANVDVRLNIDNLTDEEYVASANWQGRRALLGDPRTVTLSTDFRF